MISLINYRKTIFRGSRCPLCPK